MGGSALVNPADEKWSESNRSGTGLPAFDAPSCPHSHAGAPACWDCVQAGHFHMPGVGVPMSGDDGVRHWVENNAQYGAHSNSGGPTLVSQPESGLEALHPQVAGSNYQSEAPERYYTGPGLEVAQQDAAKAIPVSVTESHAVQTDTSPITSASVPAAAAEKGVAGQSPPGSGKVFVIRRKTLCWALVCAALLVVAIALGVALGITLRSKSSSSTPSTTTDVPTTTVVSSATGTGTAEPTATLTGMASCPGANGTTYTDPTTNTSFLRECGISHDGSDISHHEAYSMDDCVASCAQMSDCKGAVWINAVKQGTLNDYCWLHSEMSNTSYSYNDDAQSATKIDS